MTGVSSLYFTSVIFVSILGFLVSAILYFANRNHSFSARILAMLLFSLSTIVLFGGAALDAGFFLKYPHFYRLPVFFSLTVAPLSYLYVRTVLEQQYRFRSYDILFFVPAFLYTFSMMPMYLMPTKEKLDIIKRAMLDKTSFINEKGEGILPAGLGIVFRLFFGLAFSLAQFIMIAKWKRRIFLVEKPVPQNIETYKWLFYLTTVLFMSYFILIIEHLFQFSRIVELTRVIAFTITCTILFICAFLLFRPNILYGLTGWLQVEELQPKTEAFLENAEIAEARKVSLTLEQEEKFRLLLESHFEIHAPFCKTNYKIKDLSTELEIPIYLLSAFINQEYGKNFNELVNDFRVRYLIGLLKTSPENHQFTLEAISKMAGFNSRTAFNNAVKRITGKTPYEVFRKMVSEGD
jgi:AraC-like DNA-binding protein